MPNSFAYIVLCAWPILAAVLFCSRRISTLTASFWIIVGGYLILPVKVAIDLPLIPPLDKESIPALSVAGCCLLIRKVRIFLIPPPGLTRWCFLALMAAPVLTALTNPEPMFDGMEFKQGLTGYDALSNSIRMYLQFLPLLIGISVVRKPQDLVKLLKLFTVAAFLYAPLIFLEVRISPQLHTWIYGFFPHSFAQQVRFDGYRAIVFIGHGLFVATFVVFTLCSAATLSRARIRLTSFPNLLFVLYFSLVLVFCKSVGAWILGFSGLVLLLTMPARFQIISAVVIAVLVSAYPMITLMGNFPTDKVLEIAELFGEERAQSLEFRLRHTETLLAHATEKPWFGWGGWGRNRLHDSVTDGYWIILIGVYGILGFAAIVGILLGAILPGLRNYRHILESRDGKAYAGSLLIVSIILVDQVPNSSLSPYFWLFVGGLTGVSLQLKSTMLSEYRRRRGVIRDIPEPTGAAL